MPLQATSGAASYDAFGGGVAAVPNYIEDTFSCTLYTGNASTQTITNGIDLASEGGLVWIKSRSAAYNHWLSSPTTGTSYSLISNSTAALTNIPTGGVTAFNANGFDVTGNNQLNANGATFASWTFRKQPKFFDVVTYTGNGASTQNISHNLGSAPACIIMKRLDATSNWPVYHRALDATNPQNYAIELNSTDPRSSSSTNHWGGTAPTSTVFTVGANYNTSGQTWVAYLFAHNAGGFGLTGTDNVISCGSLTCGAGISTATLGFEPQWLLIKGSNNANAWWLVDNMRGLSQSGYNRLIPNDSTAETAIASNYISITPTGFTMDGSIFGNGNSFVYIAIRRGPMKVPTDGTSVFYSAAFSDGNSSFSTGFVTDFAINKVNYYNPDLGTYEAGSNYMASRLIGTSPLQTNSTASEGGGQYPTGWDIQNGYKWSNGSGYVIFGWAFQRAPSFADVVCYTGTGTAGQTYAHNLGAVPELVIVKSRNASGQWPVYSATLGNTKVLLLNLTDAQSTNSTIWNNTSPTTSVFTVGTYSGVNTSGNTYVAYLFATCPGVSKVGSYSGTGSTQTIDCGFTGGARFVLIKRTNTTGAWYVYDSSRGIQSGNDPYLLFNSSAAEVTNTNYVDAAATGFQVVGSSLNTSGSTYIFLAIA